LKGLTDFLTELSQKLLGEKCEVALEDNYLNNLELIEKARLEWLAAISLFNNASEKELIDHAIFTLNAAERRYIFLLKEARQEKERMKKLDGEEELNKANHAQF
jgi:hypothetical protein